MLRLLNRLVMSLSILIVASLLLFGWLLYRQPRWALDSITRWSEDRMLFYFDTEEPVVALTIDDGPDRETTVQILEVLEKYDAKATFFLIGDRIEGNEEILREAVKAGMEMGNHMMEDRMSLTLFLNHEFTEPFKMTEKMILDATGLESLSWFRPGQGLFVPQMLELVEEKGYGSVLASCFPYDTLLGDPQFSADFILNRVQPGSVILLHDRGERGQRTVEALELLLPELNQRGYTVTTLSELAELSQD